MTLTSELDLNKVVMNQKAKYLGKKSFLSKFNIHTPDRVLYLNR